MKVNGTRATCCKCRQSLPVDKKHHWKITQVVRIGERKEQYIPAWCEECRKKERRKNSKVEAGPQKNNARVYEDAHYTELRAGQVLTMLDSDKAGCLWCGKVEGDHPKSTNYLCGTCVSMMTPSLTITKARALYTKLKENGATRKASALELYFSKGELNYVKSRPRTKQHNEIVDPERSRTVISRNAVRGRGSQRPGRVKANRRKVAVGR